MNLNPGIGPDSIHISEEDMERAQCSTKPKKPLYCIAYTERKGRKLVGQKLYVHANSIEEARLQYFQSELPTTLVQRDIVGIAPVIGYFVNDKHGNDLSVD